MFKKHIMQPAHMDPNKIQMHKNVTTSLHTRVYTAGLIKTDLRNL